MNFIYDNIASHTVGLVIGLLDPSPISNKNTYGSVEVLFDRAGNNSLPFYYGTTKPESLIIPAEVYNKHGLYYEQYEIEAIEKWLFNKHSPRILSLLSPGKSNISYECWLAGSTRIINADTRVIGWSFDIICTSAYALGDEVEVIYECPNQENTFKYFNLSNINDYCRPELKIELLDNTTFFRIDNQQDPNNPMILSNLLPNDIITVDCKNEIFYSEKNDNILNKSNFNFLRLVDGCNNLSISGKTKVTIKNRILKTGAGF